jgi:hypothetical protein
MTLDEAKGLKRGDMIYHTTSTNKKGERHRAKVTSTKRWVRDPDRIRLGWKHGLYVYGEITNDNLADWTID